MSQNFYLKNLELILSTNLKNNSVKKYTISRKIVPLKEHYRTFDDKLVVFISYPIVTFAL
jgi:hypothetical protein